MQLVGLAGLVPSFAEASEGTDGGFNRPSWTPRLQIAKRWRSALNDLLIEEVTRDILTLKAWVPFLMFMLFGVILVPVLNFFLLFIDDQIVGVLARLLVLTVYMSYPVLVGLRLRDILSFQPLYRTKSNASLILDCVMLVAATLTLELVPVRENEPDILLAVSSVVGFIGYVRIGSFPAHQIRSIELKRNAGIWEYVSEAFQMMVWPIGVLWMQPRVNRIADKRTITITE